MSNNLVTDFLFAEVKPGAKAVEFLMEGEFPDRFGREVKITETDLDEYVANFLAHAAGQDVPIDVDHEKAAAAGWVKRVWRQGKKLFAEPDWNKLGKDLVGNKIYLYLSATLDIKNKIIKSISLVNFPAIKGLKPVELSEAKGIYCLADGTPGSVRIGQFLSGQIHKLFTTVADDLLLSGFLSTDERKQFSGALGDALESLESGLGDAKERLIRSMDWFRSPRPMMDDGEFIENTQEAVHMSEPQAVDREKLKEEVRQELQAELAQQQKTRVELREEVRTEVEAELREIFIRRQGLLEFANEICGGEFGLSTPPDEVVELLEAIPADQLEAAKKLLKAKVVEFGERGSAGAGQSRGAKLPDYAVADVKAGRLTVAGLFKAKAVAGKPDDYDLSEFDDKQKGF